MKIFCAPKLPIKADGPEAAYRTLSALTDNFLHRSYDQKSSIRELKKAKNDFTAFRTFCGAQLLSSYPVPTMPHSYVTAVDRWFEAELESVTGKRRGGVPKRLQAFMVPCLLALYTIAFHRKPNAGNPVDIGPTVRFLKQYFIETQSALNAAEYRTTQEREHFLQRWRQPAYLDQAVRRHPLRPEPSSAGPAAKFPKWLGAQILGTWGYVALVFQENGGRDPYRPEQS